MTRNEYFEIRCRRLLASLNSTVESIIENETENAETICKIVAYALTCSVNLELVTFTREDDILIESLIGPDLYKERHS